MSLDSGKPHKIAFANTVKRRHIKFVKRHIKFGFCFYKKMHLTLTKKDKHAVGLGSALGLSISLKSPPVIPIYSQSWCLTTNRKSA